MTTNDSISTDELKSLILQVTTRISGLDSIVTGSSAKILSAIRKGDDLRQSELSSSQAEALIAITQEDSGDSVGLEEKVKLVIQKENYVQSARLILRDPVLKLRIIVQCTIQNNVLNVQQDTRIHSTFDMKRMTVNLPKAEVLQTGNNSKLIINKNDVDFDKFKEEIFDHMNTGNNEILDVLKNFKDQYNKNTKTEPEYPDEVSNTLSFIINEVEKIRKWQNQLVDQGVGISYKIQGVLQSLKMNNRSLTQQLRSEKIKNEKLQSELQSMKKSTRSLDKELLAAKEENTKLQIELDNLKAKNETLQQQKSRINMI
ncbi:unnamed protein product [Mytilus edulis]|uniref:Uncharacterized protein n=1 Tax=Mytilus edulis TaxID=6550 RepID=A0A8S3Q0S9_MYTED|nr:unnamed protein product [Mytilus edulis]